MTYRGVLSAVAALAAAGTCETARASVQCSAPIADGSMACFIDPSIDTGALCNDGTLPAFWVRPGSGSGMHHWVIWLQGGGMCIDKTSCSERAQSSGSAPFVTSNGFQAESGNGLLASSGSTNPILYNANTVLIHYCSSDYWSGDAAPAGGTQFSPTDPGTWYFRGRRIALAAIASLSELRQNFAGAKQILLGGDSAGGLGITVTTNDIAPLLPPAHDVRLVNDAGFALDIGQFSSKAPVPYIYHGYPNAFDTIFIDGMKLWQGRGDKPCDASAHTTQQHINCYNSSYVLQNKYIAQPAFVAESQLDMAQLTDQLCPQDYGQCGVPHSRSTPQGVYAVAFGNAMAATLTGGGTGASYAVFSPDKYMHVILADKTEFNSKFQFGNVRLSPQHVLDTWLTDPHGNRIVDIGTGPGLGGAALPVSVVAQ